MELEKAHKGLELAHKEKKIIKIKHGSEKLKTDCVKCCSLI